MGGQALKASPSSRPPPFSQSHISHKAFVYRLWLPDLRGRVILNGYKWIYMVISRQVVFCVLNESCGDSCYFVLEYYNSSSYLPLSHFIPPN